MSGNRRIGFKSSQVIRRELMELNRIGNNERCTKNGNGTFTYSGNADLDKATLDDHAAEVEALTGSCVCCEGFHELVEMILKASESKHEVLFIELNGTADPVPLQESFTLLESKFCLRPRWQVCVIDHRSFGKRGRYDDLEKLQLETASHYYISRNSEVSEEEELKLEKAIKAINPRASRTTAMQLADGLNQSMSKNQRHTIAPQSITSKNNRLQDLDISPKASNTTDHRHKLSHEFTGCQIMIPKPVDIIGLKSWLEKLPASVIRAKALVTLTSDEDADRRHLYERVGMIVSPEPVSARTSKVAPCSGIFIGPDLEPEELLKLAQEYLHPECYFPES